MSRGKFKALYWKWFIIILLICIFLKYSKATYLIFVINFVKQTEHYYVHFIDEDTDKGMMSWTVEQGCHILNILEKMQHPSKRICPTHRLRFFENKPLPSSKKKKKRYHSLPGAAQKNSLSKPDPPSKIWN